MPMDESVKAYRRLERMIAKLNGKTTLEIRGIPITELPPLPENLRKLDINGTNLEYLPATLPPDLEYLRVARSPIKELPNNLPNTISTLLCINCPQLTSLPDRLPLGLTGLGLTALPKLKTLPDVVQPNLRDLSMFDTKIKCIPDNFARNLRDLHCNNSKVRNLPNIMDHIEHIVCYRCPISSLPTNLPATLRELTIEDGLIPHRLEGKESVINYIARIDKFKSFIAELTLTLEKYKKD